MLALAIGRRWSLEIETSRQGTKSRRQVVRRQYRGLWDLGHGHELKPGRLLGLSRSMEAQLMLCDCFKSRRRLEAEILVLRHQLNVRP
jgi:hypothetical protein